MCFYRAKLIIENRSRHDINPRCGVKHLYHTIVKMKNKHNNNLNEAICRHTEFIVSMDDASQIKKNAYARII